MVPVQPSFGPSQISKARQKAEQVRESAQTGAPFAELAKANSKGPSAAQGGSIGCVSRGQLAKVFEELIFGMHVGEVSDVLSTKQGFVVLEVAKHTI
jgi:parvulin-like peptidyl-prolyl isomerase